MKPPEVAQIHREICKTAKCDHLSLLNFSDPCASCPNGHWGKYIFNCEENSVTSQDLQRVNVTAHTRNSHWKKPGDILSSVIFKITNQRACTVCSNRIKQMNQWGWWKCWKNRTIIAQWLAEEADEKMRPYYFGSAGF